MYQFALPNLGPHRRRGRILKGLAATPKAYPKLIKRLKASQACGISLRIGQQFRSFGSFPLCPAKLVSDRNLTSGDHFQAISQDGTGVLDPLSQHIHSHHLDA